VALAAALVTGCASYASSIRPNAQLDAGRDDRDCPGGLACNCPNSQTPACHLIAQTPSDPMNGICLSTETTDPHR
jgi:hypothetical protein